MGYGKTSRPQILDDRYRITGVLHSTAASTALVPRGVVSLETAVTSSGAPVVYTLLPPVPGDVLEVVALTLVSSSQAPFRIKSDSGSFFSFATASTGHDMIELATQGAAFRAIARTSSQWLVTGIRGATFSTST